MSQGEPVLRVVSWNVRHLLGDPLALHRVLRAAAPDLVCLQEAPRLPWSALQLGALARGAGLIVVGGGFPGAGTAVLRSSRLQVRDVVAFRFPRSRPRTSRRGATLVTANLPGGASIRAAAVHLGLDPAERLRHAAELTHRLAAAGLPVLVGADLNEPPGGPAWQAFARVATDPAASAGSVSADAPVSAREAGAGPRVTFSTRNPRRRIDAVLTGSGIETLESGRWQPDPRDALLASDHLPVLSLIRVTAGAPPSR